MINELWALSRISLPMSVALAMGCDPAARDRGQPPNLDANACLELPLPVVIQAEGLDRTAACRLSSAALVALVSDSVSVNALSGVSMRPREFLVRRAPYLSVGSTEAATEHLLVTIRLPKARWDADVWFSDSLSPLAVVLVHKPM